MVPGATKRLFMLLAWLALTVSIGYVCNQLGADFKQAAYTAVFLTTQFPLIVTEAVYGLP